MIIFCHILIIIATCYGHKEAAEITMVIGECNKLQVISFSEVILSAGKLGFALLGTFLSICVAPCHI